MKRTILFLLGIIGGLSLWAILAQAGYSEAKGMEHSILVDLPKGKMPLPPRPMQRAADSRSYDNLTPYSNYTLVGNTALCYRQLNSAIDVRGYFNGTWYKSTYSDAGYRTALSVTTEGTTGSSLYGPYLTNWTGIAYTYQETDKILAGETTEFAMNSYSSSITDEGDNQITLKNITDCGGHIKGIVDFESKTIAFPSQTIYISGWGCDAIFCKVNDNLISTPKEEYATGDVIATFDQEFNISIDNWALLVKSNDEESQSILYYNNVTSLSPVISDGGNVTTNCSNGDTYNGVTFKSYVEQQGELARICYQLVNTNAKPVTISLGTHADVMIGSNDLAPIERRKDQADNTYGLTMKDGYGAQLCVLFGSGLAGVTRVDDYWFGYYTNNNSAYQMIGNYDTGGSYMVENGSYDSGMGWCWKNRTISAFETMTFSYLIGVGEVNLEPNSSFAVTPDDPDGWNDLTLPHRLTLTGVYESPAGIDGKIEYAVEDSEEWQSLTEMMASGTEFEASLVAQFDVEKEIHTIRFRTIDNVGNATMLAPIIYKDVYYHELSGIQNMTYNFGEPLVQTNVSCDLDAEHYELNDYQNNINVGTASFKLQGVFPETIGRRTYTFDITPATLNSDIELLESEFVYNGSAFTPEWQFADEKYNVLEAGTDYKVVYLNNLLPGSATLQITGGRNTTGTISTTFFIDKAQVNNSLYDVILPDVDISYDGQPHGASGYGDNGVGAFSFDYYNLDTEEWINQAPSAEGRYEIYLTIAEGSLYYGIDKELVGTFAIYVFDPTEWTVLCGLYENLLTCGWNVPWDLAAGRLAVKTFEGLVIERGHLTGLDLSNKGLTSFDQINLIPFTQLETLNLSHNSVETNVGIIAALAPSLTRLDVSYNNIADLYPEISENVTDLDVSHQTINRTITLDIANPNLKTLVTEIPTIMLYNHASRSYSKNLSIICTTSDAEEFSYSDDEQFAVQIGFAEGDMTFIPVSNNLYYYGASGDKLKVFALDQDGNLNGTTMKLALLYPKGDANFTGDVDVLDLQTMILAWCEVYSLPFNFSAADLWTDNKLNVQDMIAMVNLLTMQTIEIQPDYLPSRNMSSSMTDAKACIYIEDGKVILSTSEPVAALDIAVSGSVDWDLTQFGLEQTITEGRVIGYSFSGLTIPAGVNVLGSTDDSNCIIYACLSDEAAVKIPAMLNSSTSGINDINIDNLKGAKIYDIMGRELGSPINGLNIVRTADGAKKIINKK